MVRIYAKMEESPAVAQHGQVMTKPHVVELILDLLGYTPELKLSGLRFLEPGCGTGEFLIAAARRLLHSSGTQNPKILANCILGIEKDPTLTQIARKRIFDLLMEYGFKKNGAKTLSEKWVQSGDFLRLPLKAEFDFVAGNPPYVRQEAIKKQDLIYYRETFSCFFDRSDLYMAFLEKGLSLLSTHGILGFICPNRFTRNRYGSKLRALITKSFNVHHAIDLAQASPFTPEVMAYPGIYVIGRDPVKHVNFFNMTNATSIECNEVRRALNNGDESISKGVRYHKLEEWFGGEEPWLTESSAHIDLVRRLEERFTTLGSVESGTRVGIGVATGADRVFVVDKEFDEVEKELLVPLAMPSDCVTGVIKWTGHKVINPFKSESSSELIDLSEYPRARAYFRNNEDKLRGRNVGKRNPSNWFRTIDRIYPSLLRKPKLLIPDIRADSVCVLDTGKLYPHHNLYYVVSDYWDLKALRTILRSTLARFFVWTYGVRMRSNFLRFQAQYLRRIPIPAPVNVNQKSIQKLSALDECRDVDLIDKEVCKIYGLTKYDLILMRKAIEGHSNETT